MSFKALFAAVAILLGAGPILILAPIVAPAFAQGARPAAPPPASSLIDLNSASRDDLMSLDGIGEVRADAIIRARPFKAKTEALYEKIADKVMARPPPAAPPARPAQPAPRRT